MKSQSTFPVLTSGRLLLRQLVLEDAGEIVKLRSDEQVNKYLDRPETTNYNEAVEFIKKIEAGSNNKSPYWAISLKDAPKLIGTICLWNVNPQDASIEIGYELHPDYQRKGIMQEALTAVIAYAFETLNYQTIVAFTHEANQLSIALLERSNFKPPSNPGKAISPEIIYSLQNLNKKA